MNKVFLVVFVVLSALFVLRYFIVGQAVYGDGLNYWSYTHSIYFDHDLNISNQFQHLFSPDSNNSSPLPRYLRLNNNIEYRYPPFASIGWLPAFLLADFFVVITQPIFHLARNGFSDVYQITIGLFNVSLVTIGLYTLFRLFKKYYDKNVLIISFFTMFSASNLIYYGCLDVINSHPTSFFLASVFVFFFIKTIEKPKLNFIVLLGFLSGLLAATRIQDGLFFLLVFYLCIFSPMGKNHFHIKKLIKLVKLILFSILAFLLGFSPQIIFWKITYGSLIHSPYDVTPGYFNFLHPKLLELLTNSKTGIIYFSPILLLSLIGLIVHIKKDRFFGIISIFFVLSQYYLIASWGAWHQGASYGNRMLISSFPFLIFGLSTLVKLGYKKIGTYGIFAISLLFVILNFYMIFYFQLILQENSYISGNNTQELILNKFRSLHYYFLLK